MRNVNRRYKRIRTSGSKAKVKFLAFSDEVALITMATVSAIQKLHEITLKAGIQMSCYKIVTIRLQIVVDNLK